MVSAFIAFRKEILKKLKDADSKKKLDATLKSVDKDIADLTAKMQGTLTVAMEKAFIKNAEDLIASMKSAGVVLGASFLQAPTEAIRASVARAPLIRAVDQLGDRASRIIQKTTTQALVRGDSIDDMAKELSQKLNIEKWRAATIARTNIIAAGNEGQLETFKANEDSIPSKRWSAVFDDRTSLICLELNGQEVLLSEKFHSDILNEDFDAPPAHPNCRSHVEPVFEKESLNDLLKVEVRRVRDYNTGDYIVVDADIKSADWLAEQPEETQHKILGSWTKVEQFQETGRL